jgi:outer membrane lipase/esterase
VAGVAVQFADSDIEFNQLFAPPGQADVESWQIAGYFSHGFGPVYLDAIGSATFNSYETNRVDFLGQPISADYDSTVYSIYGELGTIIGDARSLRFQPFAGVGYRSADVDDFVETCPVACLAVTTDDPDSFYTDVGLALSKSYQWGSSTFMPELRASWTHEFDDNRNVFTADLLGLPGVPFQVTGSEFDEDRFNLGANATLAVNQGLELYAGYRYTFADDLDAHTALAGFRATW